ncbi:hypothetical protein PENSPDRAFT_191751 [Peniophora sp. CONT]|nr:hypothetical protein PENSPDRAFT_191751 [Peniophora sp. CONT]
MASIDSSTAGATAAQEGSVVESRLELSDELIANAKGAAKVTIVALSIAAKATQNVAYIGVISLTLTEFINIQDEVDKCKDECRATMADAHHIKSLIQKFRDECVEAGKSQGVLGRTLRELFTELERLILECILTFQQCKVASNRKKERLRLILKRGISLVSSVKDCVMKMRRALQQFNASAGLEPRLLTG